MQTKPDDYIIKSHEEFDKYMVSKFPLIFAQRGLSMMESCMYFGIDCGNGWQHLIENACNKIDYVYKLTGIYCQASQIKEKYGTLRFYTQHIYNEKDWLSKKSLWVRFLWFIGFGDVELMKREIEYAGGLLDDIISDCEHNSEFICESCGSWGRLNQFGWISNRCDIHRAISLKYISNEKEYNNIYEAFVENWYKEDSKRAMRRNNNEEYSYWDDIGKCDHIG